MSATAQIRSRVYETLSIAYSPPREELGAPGGLHAAVVILRQAIEALAIPVRERVLAAMEVGGQQAISEPGQGDGTELEAEYNRLFVGPGAPRVYPYESLYRDCTGLVMGPSVDEVLQAYHRNGLAVNSAFRNLPDHIAVELEFMAYLCAEEGKAGGADRTNLTCRLKEEQRSFLVAHLAHWLPTLCERVICETTSPVYRGLAEIAAIFVRWDRERLDSEQVGKVEAET